MRAIAPLFSLGPAQPIVPTAVRCGIDRLGLAATGAASRLCETGRSGQEKGRDASIGSFGSHRTGPVPTVPNATGHDATVAVR
jgi:hypothetical protein